MAIEKVPTWQRVRKILAPTGPEAVGNRPSATAGPTRPVTRRKSSGTNARTIERPAQGRQLLDTTIPDPVSER